jgi:hypothetical protein
MQARSLARGLCMFEKGTRSLIYGTFQAEGILEGFLCWRSAIDAFLWSPTAGTMIARVLPVTLQVYQPRVLGLAGPGVTYFLFPCVAWVTRSNAAFSALMHSEMLDEMKTARNRPTQVGAGRKRGYQVIKCSKTWNKETKNESPCVHGLIFGADRGPSRHPCINLARHTTRPAWMRS